MIDADRSIEEALADSERRFLGTFEQAAVGMAHVGLDGRWLEVNGKLCEIVGYERRELLDRTFQDITHPDDLDADLGLLRRLVAGEIPHYAMEKRYFRKDGEVVWVNLTVSKVGSIEGAPAYFLSVIEDITRRKRAEEALHASHLLTVDILGQMTDACTGLDREFRYTYVNRRWELLFGKAAAEVIGMVIWDAFPAIVGTVVEDVYRGAMERKVAGSTEFLSPILGRWLMIRAFPTEQGVASYILDIDDRKRAEVATRESEGRFRTMAESIPQLAWMARPDGHIYWYNRRWHEYTGTTPEEMEGWGWKRVHDPEVLPIVMERWVGSLERGEPFDMVFPLRGADGQFRHFLTRVMPVRDDEGRVAHWFGTNTDISEARRHEEELRAAKEDAEAANRAKDQFLAVLSHELRTPLNPILLATSAMLDRPHPVAEVRPTLEMIKRNVELEARLIDDLLDVMRIVQGKIALHWQVADAHALIRQACQVCKGDSAENGLNLTLDLSARRHHVRADASRLQQVFRNLVTNAIKFTPPGGAVAVRTRDGDGDRLVVEVADDGIGIEPTALPHIFDPFRQAETGMTRKFGGLGLGLAIGRGIVEAHGGTLDARSPGKGRGTTFTLTLVPTPHPADAAPADDLGAGDAEPVPRPLSILLVEDDPTTLRVMTRLLRSRAHRVTTAGTLEAGLAAARAWDYDLLISDIGLPDGSGLDLMRRVVAQRGPVLAIALTGYGMEEDIRRSLEAGFASHMTKPIDFPRLEAVIRKVSAGA